MKKVEGGIKSRKGSGKQDREGRMSNEEEKEGRIAREKTGMREAVQGRRIEVKGGGRTKKRKET